MKKYLVEFFGASAVLGFKVYNTQNETLTFREVENEIQENVFLYCRPHNTVAILTGVRSTSITHFVIGLLEESDEKNKEKE